MAIADYGIDVRQSLLEDSGLPERSFDVVSATHVLEHMHEGGEFLTPPDPSADLADTVQAMLPPGVVVVQPV